MADIPPELRYKFSPELLAQLERHNSPVKVLIQLSPGISISSAASTLASVGASIEQQFSLTNQVSVVIDEANLGALAAIGSIVQIYHVPKGSLLGHRGIPHAGILPLEASPVAVNVTLEDTTNYVGAPKMWDRGFKGQGVKVGVIDTGIDKDHPMLEGKVVAEKHFAGSGPEDNNGHGTWVASALAGKEWGVPEGVLIGVAPEATIVNAKAFDTGESDLDVIMAALEWAALEGCHVLSNSWGGDAYPPLLDLVRAIVARGQVVVAAIGNSGPLLGSVQYPGGYSEVIGVGSIGTVAPSPDAVANFSSRGPGPGGVVKPNLVAPGGTEEECVFAAAPGGGVSCFRGTSMATPHVSGAIALLLSAGGAAAPGVRDIGPPGPDDASGYGALTFNGLPVPAPGVTLALQDLAPAIAWGFMAFLLFASLTPRS